MWTERGATTGIQQQFTKTNLNIHSKIFIRPRKFSVLVCVYVIYIYIYIYIYSIAIRPDPYCKLCSLHEPMDRNHLGQCTALTNKTECERYWEARTKMMEN